MNFIEKHEKTIKKILCFCKDMTCDLIVGSLITFSVAEKAKVVKNNKIFTAIYALIASVGGLAISEKLKKEYFKNEDVEKIVDENVDEIKYLLQVLKPKES